MGEWSFVQKGMNIEHQILMLFAEYRPPIPKQLDRKNMKQIVVILSSLLFLLPLSSKGQEQVTLDSSQQEIAKVIAQVMRLSEQEQALENASAVELRAVAAVRAISGSKEYSLKATETIASVLTLENNHIIVLPKYQESVEGATWDGVSLFELAEALDDFRSKEQTTK